MCGLLAVPTTIPHAAGVTSGAISPISQFVNSGQYPLIASLIGLNAGLLHDQLHAIMVMAALPAICMAMAAPACPASYTAVNGRCYRVTTEMAKQYDCKLVFVE